MFSRVTPIVDLSEAKAFLRLEDGQDEALLAGMIRTASEVCEGFLDQPVLVRTFREQVRSGGEWQALSTGFIRSVTSVRQVAGFSAAAELPAGSYEVELDTSGRAWLRVVDRSLGGRIEVCGTAGIATDEQGVPEPIRHGVLRMVGYLYAARDGGGGEPPAMVTALWRPYRRMSLVR